MWARGRTYRLLNGGERLQGLQEAERPVGATNVRHQIAELLGERQQHLVVVIDGLGEERHELLARALIAEGFRDGAQLPDGAEAQLRTRATLRSDKYVGGCAGHGMRGTRRQMRRRARSHRLAIGPRGRLRIHGTGIPTRKDADFGGGPAMRLKAERGLTCVSSVLSSSMSTAIGKRSSAPSAIAQGSCLDAPGQ